jgi:hypothetical protein
VTLRAVEPGLIGTKGLAGEPPSSYTPRCRLPTVTAVRAQCSRLVLPGSGSTIAQARAALALVPITESTAPQEDHQAATEALAGLAIDVTMTHPGTPYAKGLVWTRPFRAR